MMLSAFKEIKWDDFDEAVPAFFAGIFMAICYSISYGIAAGFIFYCITKICKKQAKEIHPILWVVTILFILNFVLLALISSMYGYARHLPGVFFSVTFEGKENNSLILKDISKIPLAFVLKDLPFLCQKNILTALSKFFKIMLVE